MIPVICTTNIEPDLINEFLVKTYAGEPDAPEDLCVITTQDWSQYRDEARLSPKEARKQGQVAIPRGGGPMKSPSRPPWTTRFETPFKNLQPEDIAQFLQNAKDIPSSMDRRYCVILDERTLEDKSVILVKTSRGPESNLPKDNQSPIFQYRSSLEDTDAILQTVCVGQGSLEAVLWDNSSNRYRLSTGLDSFRKDIRGMCEQCGFALRLLTIAPSFVFFVPIYQFAPTKNQDLLRTSPLMSWTSHISSLPRSISVGIQKQRRHRDN